MNGLRIVKLSGMVTIQDEGRMGFQRFGVPRGGAADRFALAEGQALLGNSRSAAALEFQFLGGVFRAEGDMTIATSGAEMNMSVNGLMTPWRTVLEVKDGELISLGNCKDGTYGYLHLCGGIDSPVILNSRSTHAQSGIGYLPKSGDLLKALDNKHVPKNRYTPKAPYFGVDSIRIMKGPQSSLFKESDLRDLERTRFKLTTSRNRMGAMLESSAAPILALPGLKLISDPIVAGDIQVAADGIPTVLLVDCQPIGGYPRIAKVIEADLHRLAQMPTAKKFSLAFVDPEEATRELFRMKRTISGIESRVRVGCGSPGNYNSLMSKSLISGIVRGDENDFD